MQKSPLTVVKERFKTKQGLLDAVKALSEGDLFVDRLNEDKGLARVSNRKLLHLHDVLAKVKKDHGSRGKLIDAVLTTTKRSGDKDYRAALEKQSTPSLADMLRAKKPAKAAAKTAAPKAAAKAAAKPAAKTAAKTAKKPKA
jgi:hypothetical protein